MAKKETILSDDSARSVKSLQKQLPPIVLILVQSVALLSLLFTTKFSSASPFKNEHLELYF